MNSHSVKGHPTTKYELLGYKLGYQDALIECFVNTKELISELGEEQGLKVLRDWLKHELNNMGGEE